jgi:glycosyltransferase 2 family protein
MQGVRTTSPEAVPRPVLERLGASAAQLSSLRPANALLRRALWFSLAALVVASVAAAIVASWSKLPEFDWRFDAAWLIAALVAFTILNLGHAALWHLLLRALNQDVDQHRARSIWCTSGLARYTPGSMLTLLVRVAMSEKEGVPKRITFASLVYEMALLLTGAVAVGAYALVSAPALGDHPARYAILALPFIALAALHPKVFRPLADRLLERLGREPLPFAIPFGRVLGLAALYSLTWLIAGFGLYALLEGIYPAQPDDFFILLAGPAVGYVAAMFGFFLPGGLGARETGLAALLAVAVPVAVAVAVAVALRLLQLGIELLCAALAPLVARRAR